MNRFPIPFLLLALLAQPVLADSPAAPAALDPADQTRFAARAALLKEYPHIVEAMSASPHAGFGGPTSRVVGSRMYSRSDPAAIADVRAKLTVEPQGERTWLLRMPFVNVAVFDTDEGLVLVDSGYAAAGPAIHDALRKLSTRRVHTIVYTHHHADHAFGAWALLEAGERPRIVATDSFLQEVGMDIRLANYTNVRLNDQAPQDVPRSTADLAMPTQTFSGELTLRIGGEDFRLQQARGETADQLWVHVPGREVVVSADYHQPFLPNAGNGKRRQRYLLEWAGALRAMIATGATRVLPLHGPAIEGHEAIEDKLGAVASALESVDTQVVEGLNAGLPQHEIFTRVALPPALAARPDMVEYYNRVPDLARMVLREYSGWWDDVPSHWSPAPLAAQARELITLAGGQARVLERIEALRQSDTAMACHLADWAWYASPDDPAVLRAALAAYAARIRPGVPAQEINVYLSHMSELKRRLDAADGAP